MGPIGPISPVGISHCALDKPAIRGLIALRLKIMSNSPGPGTSGNVIAAVCSFFIPGLGQLVQGRIFMALIQFVLAGVLWIFLLGWLIHLWSVIDAALYRG